MQMLGLRLVVGLALLASSAAFHGPGLAMGPACKVGYLSGRADFPSRPLPAAAAKTKDEDGEELSEDDKKRRCVSRSGVLRAAVWALTASTAGVSGRAAAEEGVGGGSWLIREVAGAPDPVVEAKRRLEQDFEARYGKSSAYAKRLVAPVKTKGLAIDELQAIIEEDFVVRQYFVTGNMTRSIYADDCRFRDPTTDVRGLKRYILAVSNLFDASTSSAQLESIQPLSDNQIKTEWVLRGTLKLPWKPYIPPVRGTTVYHINADGLIALHDETWDVSAWAAALAVVGVRIY